MASFRLYRAERKGGRRENEPGMVFQYNQLTAPEKSPDRTFQNLNPFIDISKEHEISVNFNCKMFTQGTHRKVIRIFEFLANKALFLSGIE